MAKDSKDSLNINHNSMRFIIFLFLSFCNLVAINAQNPLLRDSTSLLNDTIELKAVSVGGNLKKNIKGMLSGNISLDVEAVSKLPSITGILDILKVLELTPSVRTSGEANSNIYVRGGDAGQNLVLYNNTPCYTPGHALGLFPLFNPDHVKSLTLYKSGTNAQYGGFLSSVIDINSKKEMPTDFSLKGNIGLLATHLSIAIPIGENWAIIASGRKSYLKFILDPIVSALGAGSGDLSYDFWDSNLTVLGKIDKKNSLQVDVMLGSDDLSIVDEDIIMNGDLNWYNYMSSLNLDTEFNAYNSLEQCAFLSSFSNKVLAKQGDMYIHQKSSIQTLGYKNNYKRLISKMELNTGISYVYSIIEPNKKRIVNSGLEMNPAKEGQINTHDFSLFFTGKIKFFNKLAIEPGIRYNIFHTYTDLTRESKTYQSIDVRLNMQYELDSDKFMRSGYSHNNQYINKLTPSNVGLPTDFWIGATKQIKPQSGDEVSIGYYQYLNNGYWEFSLDTYYRKLKDVTEFDYNFAEDENISYVDKIHYGRGRSYGIEFMFKKNYGKLTGWISYALGKSERKFEHINDGKYFPSHFDRTHDLSISLSNKFSAKFDASLSYVYATGNTYTQPTSWYFINNSPIKEYSKYNNARMPDYSRVDLSLNYWFSDKNGLNFSLYNMLAQNNPIYIFMKVKQHENGYIDVHPKKKRLYTIIPSISWNFKF